MKQVIFSDMSSWAKSWRLGQTLSEVGDGGGFTIGCGECFFCQKQLFSSCDNSNPNAWMAEKLFGHSTAAAFGYSHLTGGFAGG
jgi:threonine dehydrogenase-like Zn-dependent dehydrogenase